MPAPGDWRSWLAAVVDHDGAALDHHDRVEKAPVAVERVAAEDQDVGELADRIICGEPRCRLGGELSALSAKSLSGAKFL